MTCRWDSITSLCRSAVPATPNNNNKSKTSNIVNTIVLLRILFHVFDCTSSTSTNYTTHFVVTIYNSNNVSIPVVPSTRNSDTLQGLFQSAHVDSVFVVSY